MTDNPVAEIIARALFEMETAGATWEVCAGKTLWCDNAHAIIAALEEAGYGINKKAPPPE